MSESNTDADVTEELTQENATDELSQQDATDQLAQENATEQLPTETDRPSQTTDGFEARSYLYRGALALFVLLAVVAVVQLYGSVNATINTFISHEYRSLFRAAFNLVVLLLSGIGISWTVRELSGE